MHSRYTQFDEDTYRLPNGMRRVGYDADTQRYTFRDSEGYFLGEPGDEYGGRLSFVGPLHGNERDDDFSPPAFNAPNSPYRPLLPFFVIVGVVLLLLIKIVYSGASSGSGASKCPSNTLQYTIRDGDTCWDISQTHNIPLENLQNTLPCDTLIPGTRVCLDAPQK
ncbi:hypothetical protein E3P99_00602 [Wallemia hederae]|uniref:LysM domain-containing protein n=1 Tax=Wallemia hederae TaxID=1540922 RepID=A0A4T0FV21_9BASI|nr:hypothetical protein E3P99_00602 [Wallemia hederae]